MPAGWASAMRVFIAWLVLIAFSYAWWKLGIDLIRFKPTDTQKKLEVGTEHAAFAGLVSMTVATATATALGFEIKKDIQLNGLSGWWNKLKKVIQIALQPSTMIAAGCIVYGLTGMFIVYAYLANVDEAPEMVSAFYLTIVGWAIGAFTAAFKED